MKRTDSASTSTEPDFVSVEPTLKKNNTNDLWSTILTIMTALEGSEQAACTRLLDGLTQEDWEKLVGDSNLDMMTLCVMHSRCFFIADVADKLIHSKIDQHDYSKYVAKILASPVTDYSKDYVQKLFIEDAYDENIDKLHGIHPSVCKDLTYEDWCKVVKNNDDRDPDFIQPLLNAFLLSNDLDNREFTEILDGFIHLMHCNTDLGGIEEYNKDGFNNDIIPKDTVKAILNKLPRYHLLRFI